MYNRVFNSEAAYWQKEAASLFDRVGELRAQNAELKELIMELIERSWDSPYNEAKWQATMDKVRTALKVSPALD